MATATFEIGNVQVDKLTEPTGGPSSSFGDTITAPGIDAPASAVFNIAATNATALNLGHTGLTTYAYGGSLFIGGNLDVITAGPLSIGTGTATRINFNTSAPTTGGIPTAIIQQNTNDGYAWSRWWSDTATSEKYTQFDMLSLLDGTTRIGGMYFDSYNGGVATWSGMFGAGGAELDFSSAGEFAISNGAINMFDGDLNSLTLSNKVLNFKSNVSMTDSTPTANTIFQHSFNDGYSWKKEWATAPTAAEQFLEIDYYNPKDGTSGIGGLYFDFYEPTGPLWSGMYSASGAGLNMASDGQFALANSSGNIISGNTISVTVGLSGLTSAKVSATQVFIDGYQAVSSGTGSSSPTIVLQNENKDIIEVWTGTFQPGAYNTGVEFDAISPLDGTTYLGGIKFADTFTGLWQPTNTYATGNDGGVDFRISGTTDEDGYNISKLQAWSNPAFYSQPANAIKNHKHSTITLNAHYWDGAASQPQDAEISHRSDTNTTSHLSFQFGTSEVASIDNNGILATVGFAGGYRTASSTVTMTNTDYWVGVSGSGSRTVNLPAANTTKVGQVFLVQEIGNSSGTITINRAGSDTINNALTSVTITIAFGYRTFISDGVSQWYATNAV